MNYKYRDSDNSIVTRVGSSHMQSISINTVHYKGVDTGGGGGGGGEGGEGALGA